VHFALASKNFIFALCQNKELNGHTISRLTVHLVWSTKYRYSVLKGDIQKSCRGLLIQIFDAEDIVILKGVVSHDHVHMHIEYRPSQDISTIVKKLKGRTSRKIQEEFPILRNKYWVDIFGRLVLDVGVQVTLRIKW
jgi:putative transposase